MPEFVIAKDKIMEDYLTSLLTEAPSDDEKNLSSISQLLENNQLDELTTAKSQGSIAKQLEQAKELASAQLTLADSNSHIIESEFQVLFFDVAGLTLAVPLTELGGIHRIEKIVPLIGKPKWFKGVMLHREQKLNVVDTANWVMPEKSTQNPAASIKYQYLIMLNESAWGLACEALVATSILQTDDVKWRTSISKRPWLAGTVKEKMCVLINVNKLIELLDNGFASNEE